MFCNSSSQDQRQRQPVISYDWKSNILQFPGITTNRKNGNLSRTEHTH